MRHHHSFELYLAADGLQFAGDVLNRLGRLRRIRSIAVRCYSRDVRPACKRSRWSELPAAIVSDLRVSAAKRQRVSAMATRSDSSLPLAFAAHQLAERRKTMKAREKRLRENDFAIQASQTLSEEPSIINIANRESRSNIALPDRFFVTRHAVCHSERSEESQFLSIYAFAKPDN
jgi:hypothetical protein